MVDYARALEQKRLGRWGKKRRHGTPSAAGTWVNLLPPLAAAGRAWPDRLKVALLYHVRDGFVRASVTFGAGFRKLPTIPLKNDDCESARAAPGRRLVRAGALLPPNALPLDSQRQDLVAAPNLDDHVGSGPTTRARAGVRHALRGHPIHLDDHVAHL